MAALVGYMLHVGNLCFLKTAEITDKGGGLLHYIYITKKS